MLKAWIDRVPVCGTCYGGNGFSDQSGRGSKKALVTVTFGDRATQR